jgi:hypothetical protein
VTTLWSNKYAMFLFLVLGALSVFTMVQLSKAEEPRPPSHGQWRFISCDAAGSEKSAFLLGDNVYVKGGSFMKHHKVSIYVIPNGKIPKPGNVVSGPVNATTDSNGCLPITCIWNAPLKEGYYDVWVDQNGDGKYWCDDRLCLCCCPYLFYVIPEYLIGSVGAVVSMLGAFALFRFSKGD